MRQAILTSCCFATGITFSRKLVEFSPNSLPKIPLPDFSTGRSFQLSSSLKDA